MRQKAGRTRFATCANNPGRSVPAHSTSAASWRTAKLIVLGADSMPSSSNSAMSRGYVRSLYTRNPVSTGAVIPSRLTSTVCVCPPG